MPMTTSADEAVKVQVTPAKWKPGAVGGGGSRAWRWAGDLADVQPNAEGVYVYEVPEGLTIDLHLENRGSHEVSMWMTMEQVSREGARNLKEHNYVLEDGGEGLTDFFRVGGDSGAMDVRFRDFRRGNMQGPILLHLRFVCSSTGNDGGPTRVGCLLAQLRANL